MIFIYEIDCRPDDFYCEDGNCVSYSSLCNGVQECRDGSDEKDCGNYYIVRNKYVYYNENS
jgi:hypothetical protein